MDESDTNIPPDMYEAIEDCYERCNAIVQNYAHNLDTQLAPAIVYHYTDSAGLLGILESGTFRLTDIFGLNDPSELRHGISRACEIFTAEAQLGHPAATIFAEKFNSIMNGRVDAVAHFFAGCLSRASDDLGQWRAYGDDGRGFAIGFDGGLLDKAFIRRGDEDIPGNATFPVTYDDKLLREMHQKLVGVVIPLIAMPAGRNLANAAINKFMKMLSVNFSVCVIRAAIFFKHEAYANEQEYRLLKIFEAHQSIDGLRRRARHFALTRFTDFDWKSKGHHVLREIVIGPAADESAARSFIHECLRAGGFDPKIVIIRQSKIPYRCG
jgi:hypothetical protein